jgi:hypothetical protein
MSRAGYSDGGDNNWQLIRWRGAVNAAIKGARGQAFLKELAAAMDAMPVKSLTTSALEADGEYCALGVIGAARGKDLSKMDTEDWGQLSREFGIAEAMVREIMNENDECIWRFYDQRDKNQGPARWKRMRGWIDEQLAPRNFLPATTKDERPTNEKA